MLKNILKTNGAQQLSKNELQTINGGGLSGASNCFGTGDPDATCRCDVIGKPYCIFVSGACPAGTTQPFPCN